MLKAPKMRLGKCWKTYRLARQKGRNPCKRYQIDNWRNFLASGTLFFLNKNVVFPAQAEYSYFSADFRLKIFLYYS